MSNGDLPNGGRVTNAELWRALDERTSTIRAEQKSEHWKTRLILVGLMAAHIGITTVPVVAVFVR